MKLIKSWMLVAICLSTTNFLFAQQEPAVATKPVEIKPAVVQDTKPNAAIISKQQNPAELKITDSQNNITATTKEEMPKPQVVPANLMQPTPASTIDTKMNTDKYYSNKPVLPVEPPQPVNKQTTKQKPASKPVVVVVQ